MRPCANHIRLCSASGKSRLKLPARSCAENRNGASMIHVMKLECPEIKLSKNRADFVYVNRGWAEIGICVWVQCERKVE